MNNIKEEHVAALINTLYFSGRNVIKKTHIEQIESKAMDEITKLIMPGSKRTTRYSSELGTIHLVEY